MRDTKTLFYNFSNILRNGLGSSQIIEKKTIFGDVVMSRKLLNKI